MAGKIVTLEHQFIKFVFLKDHLLDSITLAFQIIFYYLSNKKKFWLQLHYLTFALIDLPLACQANKEFGES